jgi:hypothetical protein
MDCACMAWDQMGWGDGFQCSPNWSVHACDEATTRGDNMLMTSGIAAALLWPIAFANPTLVFCKKMRTCEQPDAVYFVVEGMCAE